MNRVRERDRGRGGEKVACTVPGRCEACDVKVEGEVFRHCIPFRTCQCTVAVSERTEAQACMVSHLSA